MSSSPTFTQPAGRSYLTPILVAFAALILAVLIAIHFYPATSVDVEHLHTDVLPTHTVFQSNSIVVGQTQSQDVLFLAVTLRVDNRIRLPIFLDGFALTMTDPSDAELTAKALEKTELPDIERSFPALKPLVPTPLLRETSIEPGKSAQGTVVFPLPVPQATWDTRKSAVIKIDLYHQPSLYLTLPSP